MPPSLDRPAPRPAWPHTIAASSWAQPRAKEAFVTWLCPGSEDLAEAAALYARRQARQSQVAVIDNDAAPAVAAAKVFANKFRALGGKVVYEGQWEGSDWGLTRTTRALKANWPQMLFYAGDGGAAGPLGGGHEGGEGAEGHRTCWASPRSSSRNSSTRPA